MISRRDGISAREITEVGGVKTEIAENRMISRREIGENSYEIGCIADFSYDLRRPIIAYYDFSDHNMRNRREISEKLPV